MCVLGVDHHGVSSFTDLFSFRHVQASPAHGSREDRPGELHAHNRTAADALRGTPKLQLRMGIPFPEGAPHLWLCSCPPSITARHNCDRGNFSLVLDFKRSSCTSHSSMIRDPRSRPSRQLSETMKTTQPAFVVSARRPASTVHVSDPIRQHLPSLASGDFLPRVFGHHDRYCWAPRWAPTAFHRSARHSGPSRCHPLSVDISWTKLSRMTS